MVSPPMHGDLLLDRASHTVGVPAPSKLWSGALPPLAPPRPLNNNPFPITRINSYTMHHSLMPSPTQRVKRLSLRGGAGSPQLADAYETGVPAGHAAAAAALDVPLLARATTEQFTNLMEPHMQEQHEHDDALADPDQPGLPPSVDSYAQCWPLPPALTPKQQQFVNGWLVDTPHTPNPMDVQDSAFVRVKPEPVEGAPDASMAPYEPFPAKGEPGPEAAHAEWTLSTSRMQDYEPEEEKSGASTPSTMPALSPPLFLAAEPAPGAGQGYESLARVQGKLARFLPEGEAEQYMEDLNLPPTSYTEAQEGSRQMEEEEEKEEKPEFLQARTVHGRSLRVRKIKSRSPSPDLSDVDSAYTGDETESYMPDGELDDSISPPPAVGTLEGSGESSGSSSAEPPQPTSALPVSPKQLLPSRPSTAAVPPAHIKDRLVRSAKKLLTAADGVAASVQVQVIPIYYPHKGASGAHKIRLIRVYNTDTDTVAMYAHAADVGGVVERKSNISRLFGKFESPSEKLLMNVVGAHNHTVGQESNILTSKGVRKFLQTNKMKDEHTYRAWITSVLLPKLLHDPLVIGEELLEIEASTDPNAPHVVKPKKMKHLEKKKLAAKTQRKQEAAASAAAADDGSKSSSEAEAPSTKKQKMVHSPALGAATSAPLGSVGSFSPSSLHSSPQAQRAPSSHAA